MTTEPRNDQLADIKIHVRFKLFGLWSSLLFCFIYGDYFELYQPGKLPGMIAGKMGLGGISQGVLLGMAAMMALPSLMVFLSLVLPPRVDRWLNLILGAVYTIIMVLVIPGIWHFYIFIFFGLLKSHSPSSSSGSLGPGPGNPFSEGSLKRLGTDYVDIYHLHAFDATTPVEETLNTLDKFVREGKVRYIACSNFSGWHLMKSLSVSERYGWLRYVGHQVCYSLIGRDYEWELMPLALDQGVGALVWSPLGWGRLTGKIRRGQPLPAESRLNTKIVVDYGPHPNEEHLYRVVDALDEVAAETGKTVPQIALNWLLGRPTVSTLIIGARNEEQLRANLGAVGWRLSAEHIAKLDAASEVSLAYPYWHQRQFEERNPKPV